MYFTFPSSSGKNIYKYLFALYEKIIIITILTSRNESKHFLKFVFSVVIYLPINADPEIFSAEQYFKLGIKFHLKGY